jgi:hypothetical protein
MEKIISSTKAFVRMNDRAPAAVQVKVGHVTQFAGSTASTRKCPDDQAHASSHAQRLEIDNSA